VHFIAATQLNSYCAATVSYSHIEPQNRDAVDLWPFCQNGQDQRRQPVNPLEEFGTLS